MKQDALTVIVVTPRHHRMLTYHLSYRLLQVLCLIFICLSTTVFLIAVDYRESRHNVVYYTAANQHLGKALDVINGLVQSDMIRLRTINLVIRRLNNYNDSLMKMAGLPAASLQEEELVGRGGPASFVLDGESEYVLPSGQKINTPQELETKVLSREKSFIFLKSYLEKQSEQLSSTPSIKPVRGSIFLASGFGYRISPFSKRRHFHAGVDLSGRRGTPIIATADGKVIFAGWQKGYGRTVVVKHEYGYITRYGHNNKLLVKRGDVVKRGQEIATLGSTGYSTGPHSHYEVEYKGRKMNPINYILNWQYN